MSTPAAQVARTYVAPGTVWDVARNRDHTTGAGALIPQDIGATTDRPGVWLQWVMLAGFPVAHGTVADEAAMLRLHTFAMDSADNPSPRYVAPGDSVLRTDDPGWRWVCLSGHGLTLADWERRPLSAALSGLAVDGHTHAIADIGELGASLAGLAAAIADKQAALANAADLGRITAAPGGPPLWDGGDWPGGGGAGSAAGYYYAGGKIAWDAALSAIPAGGVITISLWVRVADGGSGAAIQNFARLGASHWILRGDSTTLSYYFGLGSTLYRCTGGSAWTVGGMWHHIAARLNNSPASAELWVDARRTGSGAGSITSTTAEASPTLTVGDSPSGGEAMAGQVRDLAIWQEYLSTEQIYRLACSEAPTAIGSPTFFAPLKGAPTDMVGALAGSETGLGSTLFVTRTGSGPT